MGDEIWFLNVSNHVLFLLFNYVSRIHKAQAAEEEQVVKREIRCGHNQAEAKNENRPSILE